MRTHIDLFSGIAGFALAAEWAGVETIAFAEIDSYASRVIAKRFSGVKNYGDVRSVPALDAWLVTGGVPCQPASVAGKRLGTADDRWLWPEALAAVERGNYEWVLFENPAGILSLNDGVEFERICFALEGQGYEVQPIVIPACAVGAPHRRNRVWILAHSARQRFDRSGDARPRWRSESSNRSQVVAHAAESRLSNGDWQRNQPERQCASESKRGGSDVAHTVSQQLRTSGHRETTRTPGAVESREEKRKRIRLDVGQCSATVQDSEPTRLEGDERGIMADQGEGRFDTNITGSSWWAVEPNMGRVANGVPNRVGKLRGLGNAIVPQVAYQLIKRMIEAEEAE